MRQMANMARQQGGMGGILDGRDTGMQQLRMQAALNGWRYGPTGQDSAYVAYPGGADFQQWLRQQGMIGGNDQGPGGSGSDRNRQPDRREPDRAVAAAASALGRRSPGPPLPPAMNMPIGPITDDTPRAGDEPASAAHASAAHDGRASATLSRPSLR